MTFVIMSYNIVSPLRFRGSSTVTPALVPAPASSVVVTVGTTVALSTSSMQVSIRSATTGRLGTIKMIYKYIYICYTTYMEHKDRVTWMEGIKKPEITFHNF